MGNLASGRQSLLLQIAAVGLTLTTSRPAALATTPAQQPLEALLTPQDVPRSLPSAAAGQRTRVLAKMPTRPFGLQLCSTGRGGLQVSIPGPATTTELLLPLEPLPGDQGQQVLSTSLYRFTSEQAAERSWNQLQEAKTRCNGTFRSNQGLISTLKQGGQPSPWVLNQQRDDDPSDTAAVFGVFRRQGAVIVVTRFSRVGSDLISNAEQDGVQELAARISARLAAASKP